VPLIMFGHSLGGAIAAEAVAREPEKYAHEHAICSGAFPCSRIALVLFYFVQSCCIEWRPRLVRCGALPSAQPPPPTAPLARPGTPRSSRRGPTSAPWAPPRSSSRPSRYSRASFPVHAACNPHL
jgi:pimeloyl-ACP methyl ester carboxylesterase